MVKPARRPDERSIAYEKAVRVGEWFFLSEGRGMNCDIEFTINTSTKRFEEWLDRYRLRTLPFIVDLGEGKSLHVISAPTLDGEYRGLRIHKIEGRRSKPDPTEPSRAIGKLKWTQKLGQKNSIA